MQKATKFFTTGAPLDYMLTLTKYLEAEKTEFDVSGTYLQVKFNTTLKPVPTEDDEEEEEKKDENTDEGVPVQCKVRIFQCVDDEANAGKHCIDFTYTDPKTKKNMTRDERAPHHFAELRDQKELKNFFDATYTESQ